MRTSTVSAGLPVIAAMLPAAPTKNIVVERLAFDLDDLWPMKYSYNANLVVLYGDRLDIEAERSFHVDKMPSRRTDWLIDRHIGSREETTCIRCFV
jgi:hypothetical protein